MQPKGACLCLIDTSGNKRQSKQTYAVAYKSWTDDVFLGVALKSKDLTDTCRFVYMLFDELSS